MFHLIGMRNLQESEEFSLQVINTIEQEWKSQVNSGHLEGRAVEIFSRGDSTSFIGAETSYPFHEVFYISDAAKEILEGSGIQLPVFATMDRIPEPNRCIVKKIL